MSRPLSSVSVAACLCAVAILCLSACGSAQHGSGKTSRGPALPTLWDRPALDHPTTITISNANRDLTLPPTQDFILRCPPGQTVLSTKLVVSGGHNVALEDCNLKVTSPDWAAYLEHQTGTLWVAGLHFGGTHLTGGIQMQEPDATVVMRDVLFDRVYGSLQTNHAELIQTWCGPKRLLIDGLTGSTTYQGLFLLPNQFCSTPISRFDLRHVDINDSRGAVALWLGDVKGGLSATRLNLRDVYVVPNPQRRWRGWWLWPQPPASTWSQVIAGAPPGGSFVQPTATGATGIDRATGPPALADEVN